jgi:RNA polymerase sigma-70 factor (ECF subfamily)
MTDIENNELVQAEESVLIKDTLGGNDDAYAELVRRYQARLRGYASRYIANSHDVFELVQDAFLNAYRNLERFDISRAFYPWLRTICRNLVFNHLRSRKRRLNVNLGLVDYAICERVAADEDAAADKHDAERIDALRQCISELSQSQQKLVRARYHGRIAVKDIAEKSKISAAGISMRLGRIRDKLHKCMIKRLERAVP